MVYCAEEDGLITGYADQGQRWRCLHPYFKEGQEAFWHDEITGFAGGKWPWAIYLWTEPKSVDERISDYELIISGLRQGVNMWDSSKIGAYYVGAAAYDYWMDWLHNVNNGKVDNPKSGMQGNGWCYDVLIQNRRVAGKWLREKAEDFSGETAEKLVTVAENYDKIAELCMEDLKNPWDLALGPDKFETWTTELRKEQIDRLKTSCDLDQNAITIIKSLPELAKQH